MTHAPGKVRWDLGLRPLGIKAPAGALEGQFPRSSYTVNKSRIVSVRQLLLLIGTSVSILLTVNFIDHWKIHLKNGGATVCSPS